MGQNGVKKEIKKTGTLAMFPRQRNKKTHQTSPLTGQVRIPRSILYGPRGHPNKIKKKEMLAMFIR